ncbi:cation:proton antiporter domain-containing protein [Nocardioides bruguierae]|uniref:cation:proton antiporter domain-containing protein n=1 Tax=Nocardioides bruguierae TaxID=2945102 RepID=UPI0020207DBA|nr:cation:proton antiporter [Nocardioides bruguierae]MCL8023815.1 cation:proton antiporter [Nocardioides bruguierae]
MEVALLLISLTLVVLVVTAVSRRLDVPAPLVLTVVGVIGSYLPIRDLELEPEIVLLWLLPPLLYSAALETSLVDFRAQKRPILLLSVGLVLFTTAGVAVVVHALAPVSWPAAFAIGAVVGPPDAVAAIAIGRRIGLPRRIVTILEGESLFNDATALVALRTAIAAGAVGISAWDVGWEFVVAAGGGALVGFVVYKVVALVRLRLDDSPVDVGISLVIPFTAYVAAEEFGGSGVIAVVVAGLLLGHRAPVLQTAQSRIAERTTWGTVAFLLENSVFLLIGLQAHAIIGAVGESELSGGTIVAVCAATLAAVIVLRLVWVMGTRAALRIPGADPAARAQTPWTYSLVLGWAGMRGVVTLAAAFIIPASTPHREVLLLAAFTVVAGTLLLQGPTLPLLARRLQIPSPDPMDDALARATLLQQASKAGFARLEQLEYDDRHGVIDTISARIDQRNFAAWERLSTVADAEAPSDLYARARLEMIDAERHRVLEIRDGGTVPADVVSDVLASLDVEESMIDRANEQRAAVVRAQARTVLEGGCDHLAEHPAIPPVRNLEKEGTGETCPDCLREGTTPVALRRCLSCGYVGCCDSSPGQHSTKHFHETAHPVMQSAEPDEDWRWCYVHHLTA